MDFEWTVTKIFADIPERGYINPCCIGGDEVLNLLKPEISLQMKVDESQIEIYQEDWGWALEFSKDDVFYSLGLNNVSEADDKSEFTVVIEANRTVKKFLFTKSVEATDELNEFARVVSNIARKNNFEVTENQ